MGLDHLKKESSGKPTKLNSRGGDLSDEAYVLVRGASVELIIRLQLSRCLNRLSVTR